MGPWHCCQVNRLSIFVIPLLPIPLVVTKAILDTDDDPRKYDNRLAHSRTTQMYMFKIFRAIFDIPEVGKYDSKSKGDKEK